MSYSILNLSYDFTIEQLFAKNKQETKQYFEFQKEFSREDNVFLLVHLLKNIKVFKRFLSRRAACALKRVLLSIREKKVKKRL